MYMYICILCIYIILYIYYMYMYICILCIRSIRKASLLAGVGFALEMNWGQTGYSALDVSGRTGFGAPRFSLINHLYSPPRAQTPIQPSQPHPGYIIFIHFYIPAFGKVTCMYFSMRHFGSDA